MIKKILHLKTKKRLEIYNITKDIQKIIEANKVNSGIIYVRSLHTTTSVCLNEHENGLMRDLLILLQKMVPRNNYYHHDDITKRKYEPEDEYKRKNAFAHLQSFLLGNTITLPIFKSKLPLGQWQSILFVELDGPRKDRKIEITIVHGI